MGICLIIKSGGGVDTSSATATADKILSGYTVYVNDNKIIGSMTSVGKQTASGLNAGGSKTISAGWHDGTGSVTTNSLSSQTDGTSIAAGDVLSGCTYWSSGAKATGTMTSRGTKTWTLGANGTQAIESGWHDGKGTVKQSIGVDNNECWRTPSTAQQQVCWSGTYYSKNRGCYGASTLTAANIKKDITIFGVKGTCDSKYYVIKDGVLASGLSWCNFWLAWDEDGNSQTNTDFISNKVIPKSTDNYAGIDLKYTNDHTIVWIRGVIGKAISMSSYDTNGKLSGVLCGDFKFGYVDANPILELHMVTGPVVKKSKMDSPPSLVWKMTPTASISVVSSNTTTASYRQTGVSSKKTYEWFYPGGFGHKYATTGDFAVTIDSSYWRSPGGTSNKCGWLWCKNLWFDTSATI